MYAVKLGTQLDITIIGKKPEQSFLDFCYENIGCQCVEKVNARYLKEPYILMIDEEGGAKTSRRSTSSPRTSTVHMNTMSRLSATS